MGGAGGHMWHPFDCPDVNSGQDLIDFFHKSVEWAKTSKPALKIDGVNLSFRIRENSNTQTGYEFVIDRGSMKDLDVQGVTADNAAQRFVSKDPSKPHGMIGATEILLSIFNNALPDIMDELQQLGMLDNIGPYSKYFNTEFVLKKINVKEYAFDFIALHSVNDFVEKGPRSRKGVETQYDQVLLDKIRDKVKPHALKRDFRVFSSITTNLVRDVDLERALSEKFTIVYSSELRDPEEPGELGVGQGSTKTIKAWLEGVNESPLEKTVVISDKMIEKYPKMAKKQYAMAKNIYIEILKGTAVNEIVDSPEHVEAIADGAVIWHGTRILGNSILDSLESDEFGPANEQEGVVVKDESICGGTRFKFTGDFIVGGLETSFREQKFRTGKLLESFAVEAMPVTESAAEHIILIPGGFKPPTVGHYKLIQHYEKQSDVRKVYVITGPKPRDGVTLDQSKDIFTIYGGFSEKVEFISSNDPTPMRTCYELMQNDHFVSEHTGAVFSLGAGDKGNDPKRIRDFAKYFEDRIDSTTAKITAYSPAEAITIDGAPASASRMRKAFKEGDWDTFKKLLPDDNFYDDVVQVLNQQEANRVNESFFLASPLYSLVNEVYSEKQRRFMCAVKDKPASERPKGLSAAEAEEMCTSELAEQQQLELDGEQTKELRQVVGNLISKFVELGAAPELKVAAGIESGDINIDDTKKSLVNTIMSYIGSTIDDIMKDQDLSEASAGATGAVGGFAGPIGTHEDEREELRNIS